VAACAACINEGQLCVSWPTPYSVSSSSSAPLQLAKTAPLQLSQLCANQTTPQFNQSVQFFLAQQQGQAGGMQQPFATATAYFRLLLLDVGVA
jgi:hypothetical protein